MGTSSGTSIASILQVSTGIKRVPDIVLWLFHLPTWSISLSSADFPSTPPIPFRTISPSFMLGNFLFVGALSVAFPGCITGFLTETEGVTCIALWSFIRLLARYLQAPSPSPQHHQSHSAQLHHQTSYVCKLDGKLILPISGCTSQPGRRKYHVSWLPCFHFFTSGIAFDLVVRGIRLASWQKAQSDARAGHRTRLTLEVSTFRCAHFLVHGILTFRSLPVRTASRIC